MGDAESIIERAIANEQGACDFCMDLDKSVFSTDSRQRTIRQRRGSRGILGGKVGEAMD